MNDLRLYLLAPGVVSCTHDHCGWSHEYHDEAEGVAALVKHAATHARP